MNGSFHIAQRYRILPYFFCLFNDLQGCQKVQKSEEASTIILKQVENLVKATVESAKIWEAIAPLALVKAKVYLI